MNPITLSICIPTYNRAVYLKECLDSILPLIKDQENSTELIIFNNASTDATDEIVNNFLKQYPAIPIGYYRHSYNVGPGRNYYFCAAIARGEYVWIFGDDDKMAPNAIRTVINKIRDNYDLYICNYEIWSSDFAKMNKKQKYNFGNIVIKDHNRLLEIFYGNLGFISSIIIKRTLLLSIPLLMYLKFSKYGLSFLIAICHAVFNKCNALFISDPLVRYRGDNSFAPDWTNIFVKGSACVCEELRNMGYSSLSVNKTKNNIIRDYIIHRIIYERTNGGDINYLFDTLSRYYKDCWSFWFICWPLIVMPISLLNLLRFIYKKIKNETKSL